MTDIPKEFSKIIYNPIGLIKSQHTIMEKTPIQPVYAKDCDGQAIIFEGYAEGLKDLSSFSHIYLIYHFHRSENVSLIVKPFTDDNKRGVFSTRHHDRPNHIGLSLVRLIGIEGNVLFLSDVDVLDGTPLLDIKPFIPRFDSIKNASGGWTDSVDEKTAELKGKRDYRNGE